MDLIELQVKIDSLIRRNRTFYKHRRPFHEVMQRDLSNMATVYGFKGKTEFPVAKGYIDVVWLDADNKPILAIEIDSGVRSKSVGKLATLDKEIERIWICYSPTEIDVSEYENLIGGLVMKYEFKFLRR